MGVRSTRPRLLRGLLLAACLVAPATSAKAAGSLHVIPFPGTPDASPQSQVIFSSLRPHEIRSVVVTGSASGVHKGHLTRLPDGAGTAFVPDHPFKPGEHVRVVAIPASGAPGASSMKFSFAVGIAASWSGASPDTHRRAGRAASEAPTQNFRSRPALHPPIVDAFADPDKSSGDIFLTPVAFNPGSMQAGPMILDSQGRLIWFRPVHAYATNLEVQRYHGDPALTWWQRGQSVEGEDVIAGRSYRRIAVVRAGYGYVADIHEFQLTPRGTALIDAYVPVQTDLSSVGGPTVGRLMDCVIQEVDVKTGRVLWEWHALGHVPISAAYMGKPKPSAPYDFFHLNSVQRLSNGDLLVSARDTSSVYEIDKRTGRVLWTLGGRYSNFTEGPGAGFEWQHDAHMNSDGLMSVFDDASDSVSQEESQSSAKLIKLNMAKMTASLVQQYKHSPPVITGAEGSAQVLPNHDMFVGWGAQPEFSEYTPGGRQIFSGSLPLGIRSYRAFRFSWSAQPPNPPAMALESQSNGAVTVFASWNGATRLAAWRVLAGSRRGKLRSVAQARRTGFETTITLHTRPRYVAVEALSGKGRVLSTSRVRAVGH